MRRKQIIEVMMREIRTRARSRGYRITTGILLLLAVLAPLLIQFIPNPSDDLREVSIGLIDGEAVALTPILEANAENLFELTTVDLTGSTQIEIEQQLEGGDIDVAVSSPAELLWDEVEDSTISNLIAASLQQQKAIARASELGISPSDLATVFEPVELEQDFVAGSENTEGVRVGVAFFGLMLAFMMPQIFGQFTMMSVVEEKQTRVVEVLLSQIRPSTLLAGKILGIGALAVFQLVVLVAGLIASLLATNAVEIPASVWRFVPMMLVSVLGGLAIFITLFGLVGSLISRQEDQAQVMMPVFVPLMAGYIVGQTAAFGNAESLLARILTWFPLTAPMLLPVRVARDAIGPIEIVVSVALMAVGAFVLYRLAARLYEFTLLRTGSRVGWGEALRLSRGSAVAD